MSAFNVTLGHFNVPHHLFLERKFDGRTYLQQVSIIISKKNELVLFEDLVIRF